MDYGCPKYQHNQIAIHMDFEAIKIKGETYGKVMRVTIQQSVIIKQV